MRLAIPHNAAYTGEHFILKAMVLDFLRRRFDELLTGLFLLLVAVVAVSNPPVFATRGGLLLARWILSSAAALVVVLFVAARFSFRARTILQLFADLGPIVVAVVGYVSLRLLHAHAITAWLGIPSFDRQMLAADDAIFGTSPYLWFDHWGTNGNLFLRIMSGFYALYPLTPLIAATYFICAGNRAQFRLIRRALMISFYCGYCCYLLVPVSGPLSLMPVRSQVFLESTRVYSFLADNFRYPYDCFPSLHTANPWLIVWLSPGKLSPWLMAAAVTTCCGITLSTVALEVHYGVDDLAAFVWVFLAAALAPLTLPRDQSA